MKILIPAFDDKKDLFKYLKLNKELIMTQKKSAMKIADCFNFTQFIFDPKSNAYKAVINNSPANVGEMTELKVKVVINTTNLLDSHDDVHIPGLWKKTLSENKSIKFLQEHMLMFDKIIADKTDLKAYTENYTWKELGFSYKGETEALVFEAKILKDRNPFMFDQYAKGYVDNHSAGMGYGAMALCVDSDESYYGAEKEAWDKYIEMVANRETAEEQGYFWAVKEARLWEGSAVPLGANFATPTLDNNMKTFEPGSPTQQPEPQSTPFDYAYLAKHFSN